MGWAGTMPVKWQAKWQFGKSKIFKDHQRDRDFIISREYIGQLINHINMKIYERANSEPHLKGMGTTLTLIIHFKRTIHIAHIGDSRAYRINNQEIQQLTEDHSLVAGLIKEENYKEEAQVHPQKCYYPCFRHRYRRFKRMFIDIKYLTVKQL